MLTFNTRSILDINRRMKFSNAIANSEYNIICLCETWLTKNVTTASLFLENYQVYRNDRETSDNRKTKHGGVLIAIKNEISHDLHSIESLKSDYLITEIHSNERSIILSCVYKAPTPSTYQWFTESFLTLMNEMANLKLANKNDLCDLILTGDINFSQTYWEALSSSDIYESQLLDKLVELNLSQHAPTQLDVLLCDNPEIFSQCQIDRNIRDKLTSQFSDHKPLYTTIAAFSCIALPKITNHRYDFKRADWDSLNSSIEIVPFIPYCYSNLNEIIRQWYEWLWEKIEKFVPRITEHRSRLQPWITPATSHLIKKLQTMKRKPKQGLKRLLKITKLENDIQRFSEDDLAEYEKTVLEGRTFSKIQKYLKCIRKTPTIPSTVKDGNTESSNEREKCEYFNDYFVNVSGTKKTSNRYPLSKKVS